MNQDEINSELDHFLEQGIFNGDIDPNNERSIRTYLYTCMDAVHDHAMSDEEWMMYATHCLQRSMERINNKPDTTQ